MSKLTYTIIDSADSSFNKTSVLVTGETEALVVDAAFTRADGYRIAAAVLDSGKSLTGVVITAGDPDFYFGAEVLADAFPGVRFFAPLDVIEHIHASYLTKLKTWGQLGTNLPTRLVDLQPLLTNPVVDGHTLELRRASDKVGERAWFLFDPQARVLLGGVLLFQGLHVWTADSSTPESRAAWIEALDALEALQPAVVVAGNRTPDAATDLSAIEYTRDYLRFFDLMVTAAPDAAAAHDALLAAYPDAGLVIAASLGTKVAQGEMAWG
ncbi:MAG: MBL fold metallo-hydrolase [Micropruina sp.]|nr:MBL fold metallo-hydrolase [Micropruina sp.]